MGIVGDDSPEIVEPMHGFDADLKLRRQIEEGMKGWGQVAGAEWCAPAMVDESPVHCGKFMPVERGVDARDYRPRMRMSGRFAGEVSGFELLEGCDEVVLILYCCPGDQVVAVDLDDMQHFGLERIG